MSTPSGSAAPQDALARLRDRFRASSGKTVAVFRTLAEQLAHTPEAAELLDALRKELHRVRGTAGTYGFTEASDLAGVLEPRAIRWMEHAGLERDRRADLVRNFANALELAFGVTPEGDTASARRMMLVGLSPAVSAPFRAEGPLQGYAVTDVSLDAFPAALAGDRLPDVVVTLASLLEEVRRTAVDASLPVIALDEPGVPRVSRALHAAYDGVVVVDATDDAAMLFEVAGHSVRQTTTAGATILVVDDDPMMLVLVRALMDREGLRVVTLNDAGRLVETLEQVHPSLLLMDISMQDFDGIALTRGLRADARWRDMPIVLFSAGADAAQRSLAYSALADDFLAKPIVPDELRQRLRAQLDRLRLARLGAGQHPGTGLSLPPRTEREASRMLDHAATAGIPCALAVLRPTVLPTDTEASDAWMRECARVAQVIALGDTTVVGMLDETGLVALTRAPAEALAVALEQAAAQGAGTAGGVAWTAGIADTLTRRGGYEALCGAAGDARGLVQEGTVRRWTPDDERVAPDVIVVEDDQALSDMVQYALRAAGYSFRAFASGAEARDALLALRAGARRALVLLDIDLPGLDGHSLHEQLRVQRPGQFAVVFTTARSSEAEQLRALRAGAIDYVTKPIALRVLMAKVKVWLELAGARSA